MRTIVIGDVHGCFRELMFLLDKLKFNENQDQLIFAGDLVDRGPHSGEVVRWVRDMNARTNGLTTCVLGNHDEKQFRWFKHMLKKRENPNYRIPMRPLSTDKMIAHNSMSDEDLEFLGNLPLFVHLEQSDWVVVHAGLEPRKPLEEQDAGKVTHIRFLNPANLKTVSLGEDLKQPAGSVYWTDCYDLPHNVVYGHNVHSLIEPKITRKPNGAQLVGIDTGCCFGGELTAFIVPQSKEESVTPYNFVAVKAIKSYSRSSVFN